MREFDESFLISFNAIAFRGKISFTDLALFPHPTLIGQVLTPRDLWCKALLSFSSRSTKWTEKAESFFFHWYPNRCNVFFSNGRISLTWIKQFVEIWWWPYLFNDTSNLHHILCSLILEPKQDTCSLRARHLCTRNRSKVLLYFLCTLILRSFRT